MRRTRLTAYVALGALTAAAAAFSPMDDEVELKWHSVDAGGGRVVGADLQLVGTFGQADAERMTGGLFVLTGGFLGQTPLPCFGDTNGDASVNVDDLIRVILDWGLKGDHPGDVDGNERVDVDDIIAVIMAWGICP
ncbi:MAG: hypothetical protein ACYTJ0_04885 [Planctomycetota bacterium]|jgi:hypothetical protein